MLRSLHANLIFGRRVRVLAAAIAERLPQGARVLDIGCGSGELARLVMERRPDVRVTGIDVLVRPDTAIPVTAYDGARIPFDDGAFDAAMIVDVLHHTDDPQAVLAEVARVACVVVVKDHFRDGFAAGPTLRLMDWVGNAAHGVRLPYNYLSGASWRRIWAALGLKTADLTSRVPLYPAPLSWLFERRLHFVATLTR